MNLSENSINKIIYILSATQLIGGVFILIYSYFYISLDLNLSYWGSWVIIFLLYFLPVCIFLSGILLIYNRSLGIILSGFTYVFQVIHINSEYFIFGYTNIGAIFFTIKQSVSDGYGIALNAKVGPAFNFSLGNGPEETTLISVNLLAIAFVFLLVDAWRLSRPSS
jgi:hypothetical protein